MGSKMLALGSAVVAAVLAAAAIAASRSVGVSSTELWLHPLVAANAVTATIVAATFVSAATALATGDRRYDWASAAALEVGVLHSAWAVILGVTFSLIEWGVWWSWDPRIVSAAVMLLMFVGVLLLRSALRDPDHRLPRAAVATVLACVDLPVVYSTISAWQTVHPVPFQITSGSTLTAGTGWVVGVHIACLGALCVALGAWRYHAARARGLHEAPDNLPATV